MNQTRGANRYGRVLKSCPDNVKPVNSPEVDENFIQTSLEHPTLRTLLETLLQYHALGICEGIIMP